MLSKRNETDISTKIDLIPMLSKNIVFLLEFHRDYSCVHAEIEKDPTAGVFFRFFIYSK